MINEAHMMAVPEWSTSFEAQQQTEQERTTNKEHETAS